MPEKILYEYAVIRIVPKVEREEFVNAGVILFSKKIDYLACKTFLPKRKLNCFFEEEDIDLIAKNLIGFEEVAIGTNAQTPISKLDKPSRFRWLTATRSTMVQCGKVHPGLAEDLEQELEKLFRQLVA